MKWASATWKLGFQSRFNRGDNSKVSGRGAAPAEKSSPTRKEQMEAKRKPFPYRFEATTPEGFLQQLTANYLAHGYFFFVAGWVPEGKDPHSVDAKSSESTGWP